MEPIKCDCGADMTKQDDGSYVCEACGAVKQAPEATVEEAVETASDTSEEAAM